MNARIHDLYSLPIAHAIGMFSKSIRIYRDQAARHIRLLHPRREGARARGRNVADRQIAVVDRVRANLGANSPHGGT